MRRVILLSSHFPPSNLVGVHRARIWANLLPEFGWEPTVVAPHWSYYEESLDWDLMRFVNADVEVVRTPAFPVRPVKIIGNMAVRALWWTRRALIELARSRSFDFLHIIVPDFFSTLAGPMVLRATGLPFGVDFMDPWVLGRLDHGHALSKASLSRRLGRLCEPRTVPRARLITGVSALTVDGVMARHPGLRTSAIREVIPMAPPPDEFEAIRRSHEPRIRLIDDDGCFNLVYAGALSQSYVPILERFLEGVSLYSRGVAGGFTGDTQDGPRLRILFLGTGRSADDARGHRVLALTERLGLQGVVREFPRRIGYLDTLWHLSRSSGVLVLGNTERHYSPSKVFQALQSHRPVFAILHRESEACRLLQSARSYLLDFDARGLPSPEAIARALARMVAGAADESAFADDVIGRDYSREGAARLARALDEACEYAPLVQPTGAT